ncbi:MAG: EAL domain-containing protein [Mycobacteriales bacterium]|nr:EAL domain-containing protein [Mycobacteriales bacterium]
MPAALSAPADAPRSTGLLPAARGEAVAMLLRAAVLMLASVTLLLAEPDTAAEERRFLLAGAWHLAAMVACLGLAAALVRVRSAALSWRATLVFALLDVAAYALYSALFHDLQGAGTTYGIFVLLMAPVRWGWAGAAASIPVVSAIVAVWPQREPDGRLIAPLTALLLCVVFAFPAAAISTLVRRWAARLRQAEGLLAGAFAHASTGMALLDEHGALLQVNHAMAQLLGADEASLQGTPFLRHALADDRARVTAALATLSPSRRGTRAEVRLRGADGTLRWVLLAASWMDGQAGVPPRVVIQLENVTERKRVEQRLSHQASHDELTGLPNRTMLREQLDLALRAGEHVAVLFMDLDRFKVVNDGLGHAAGDRLLVQVGQRLDATLRPGDLVARLGGDEFVIMARRVEGESDARLLADRVLAALRSPISLGDHLEVVSASIGIALSGPDTTGDVLLRDADTAMYQAKGAGGARVAVFAPQMREQAVSAHELEVDLRHALAAGRVRVVYQPSVDLVTGRIEGVEALARWHDDVRGDVPPGEFIAVAEQSELIGEIGRFVLRQSLQDLVRWSGRGLAHVPSVAVNVSVRQLTDPAFPPLVASLLDDTGVDPAKLCLEVTETALSGDVDPVVAALAALREIGVKLSIDDFGTGHASLTYLARFPVDVVKVDRTFVVGVGVDAGSAAIVGGVVAMAHTFGLRVVAEGPETTEQLALLRDLGCDQAQGFAYARPLDIDALVDLLDSSGARMVPAPRRPEPSPTRSVDESRRYRLLLDGARDITACLQVDSVLERAFVVLRRVIDFTGGSIQLVDGDVVRLAATDPPATPEALGASIPLGQGVGGTIAQTGEPRYLPDITVASTVTAKRRTTGTSLGVRSWYGVPLVAEGRVIGVLQIDSTEVDAFGEDDRLLVLSFAPLVAAGVQNARSFTRELNALQERPR